MWYYQQNSSAIGPVSEEVIQQLTGSGVLHSGTYLRPEGVANWVPLSQALDAGFLAHHSTQASASSRGATDESPRRFGRWAYFVSLMAISFASVILSHINGAKAIGDLVVLGCFVPMVLRLNDTGRSGWWSLIAFVPILNLVLGLYLLCAPRGYAHTKKADKTMKILCIVSISFLALLLLGIYLFYVWITT